MKNYISIFFFIGVIAFMLSCGGGSGSSRSAGQNTGVQDTYTPDEPAKETPAATDSSGTSTESISESGSSSTSVPSSDVSKDTSAPFITGVSALSNYVIRIDFSEALKEDTAIVASNYDVKNNDQSISIKSVKFDTSDVELTLLSPVKGSSNYTAFVRNVQDTSGNAIGVASYKFTGVGAVTAIFEGAPSEFTNKTSFDIKVKGDNIIAYQYKLDSGLWGPETSVDSPISLKDLKDGLHNLEVIVKNSKKVWQQYSESTELSWTVDTVAPKESDLLIYSPNGVNLIGGNWNKNYLNIQIDGDLYSYQYQIDGGSWISGSGNLVQITDVSDGNHNVNVKASDKAGNWSDVISAAKDVSVDTKKPVAILTNISVPPYYNYNNISFVVQGDEKISSFKYVFDGGEEKVLDIPDGSGAEARTIPLVNVSEGSHIVSVAVKDSAGNWSDDNPYNFNVDLTKPAAGSLVLDTQILPSITNNDTASIDMSSSAGEIAFYKYQLDDGSWSGPIAVDSIWQLENLSDGNHTVNIIGIDLAGNESAPVSYTWQVDTTPPASVAVTMPVTLQNGITNQNGVAIDVSGSDIVSFKYQLNNGEWSEEITVTSGSDINLSDLPEGLNTLNIIVKDAAGNWSSQTSPFTYSWTVDTVAPTNVVSTVIPPSLTGSDSITVGIADPAAQGITEFKYQLDNGSWSDWISADQIKTVDNLSDGTHTVSIIARDEAGNESSPTTYSWSVDTTAPAAVAVNIPASVTSSNSITIDLATTDIAYYRYKLDDGSYSAWTAVVEPISIDNLADGTHTIEILGKDSVGNTQQSPTIYTWTVDTVAPVITLTADLQQNPTNVQYINVSVNGNDISSYEYSTDGVHFISEETVTKKISLTNVAEGNHVLYVKAKDLAGNVSQTVDYSWSVDITPPTVPVMESGSSILPKASIDVKWDKSSDAAGIRIQVAKDQSFSNIIYGGSDGADLGNVSSFVFEANENYGAVYYFRVKARDSVGNWSAFSNPSGSVTVVGNVSGKIMNTYGSVLQGSLVVLKSASGESFSAQTGSDGKFLIENVGIGVNKYILEATLTNYGGADKNNISVSAGKTEDVGTMYLVSSSASKGIVKATIIDANDGADVTNTNVKLTNFQGVVKVDTVFSTSAITTIQLDPGSYTMEITKSGYFPITFDNVVVNGDVNLDRLSMCKLLQAEQFRVIVQWGDTPKDIDFHLVGPSSKTVNSDGTPTNRFHIGYNSGYGRYSFDENTGAYVSNGDPQGVKSTASIVQDDTNGFGPESINLFKYQNGYAFGTYTYTLYNYSGTDWTGKKITVRIYDSQGLLREVVFTPSSSARYLKMFQVNIQGYDRLSRTINVVPVSYQMASLTFSSKSSMDWSAVSSGLTAYLLTLPANSNFTLGLVFALLVSSLILLNIFNRRKSSK